MRHPREGWTPDGTPRRRRSRGEDLLKGIGAGVGRRRPRRASLRVWRLRLTPVPTITQAAAAAQGRTRCAGRSSRTTRPIASGLEPEKNATLKVYNWIAYINQACINNFAEEVQLQGRVDDLQHDHRRDLEDQERRGRLRRLRPDAGQPRSAGRDQADPAAQPQLHPEHRASLARLQEPLLRPGLAVHGALHRLHDRHRLAEGPRRREPGYTGERLPDPVAEEVRRQGRHPRRLPRGTFPRAA